VCSVVVRAQSPVPPMKAIMVHEYGGVEVLKFEDAPRPEPKDDQVLIRVIAAGVNPVDAHIRTGRSAKFFGTTLPLIPGYDIAGIVEKAGTKTSKLKVGDPVYAYVGLDEGGGYGAGACGSRVCPRKLSRRQSRCHCPSSLQRLCRLRH